MSKNCIVTGFNDLYWEKFGAPWLISLKELASYEEEIIIFDYNLSQPIKNKLKKNNVTLIPGELKQNNIRLSTIKSIVDLSKKEDKIFVYWDADVYFQESVNEVFDLAKNNLIIAKNLNFGFLAGNSSSWSIIRESIKMSEFFSGKVDVFDYILILGKDLIKRVDNTWNFINIPNIQDINEKLCYKDVVQKAIHLSGEIKDFLLQKNILFFERHQDLYNQFFLKKSIKLFKKIE